MKVGWLAVGAFALAACGPPSQISAVDQGATRACAYYQRCGQIGSQAGALYPDQDHCTIALKGQLNSYWPPAQCNNHINGSAFNVCLTAMDNTACNNAADFLNTVLNKCGEPTVCSG
jgi:hypothetical protein